MTLRSTIHEKTSADGADSEYYVLGTGTLGIAVARQLAAAGQTVTLVGAAVDDLPSIQGDPSAIELLAEAGLSDASTVVAATTDDGRNLLLAQLVRAHFDVADVFVVVHTPDRSDLIAEAGHEPICATTALADAVVAGVNPRLTEADAV